MKKILMVCLGNICRSPLAEGILEHKSMHEGIALEIDSAGTAGYHEGEKPDRRSIEKAAEYGIDIRKQRSRPVVQEDFDRFDLILAMDQNNFQDLKAMAQTEDQRQKIELILNYGNPGSNASVPDPYYGGDEGFEHVYQLLDQACDRLIEQLK